MAVDFAKSLEDIKQKALTIQSGISNLPAPQTDYQKLTAGLNENIGSALGTSDFGIQEKSIMEKFAERKKLAETSAEAGKKLVASEAETAIGEAKELGARELTSEVESRRGFATNTALVRQIQESGEKRVRNLEKARDELFLKQDVAKAEIMNDLIEKEQSSITQARTSYVTNALNFLREMRESAGFETPEQKSQRELKTEVQKSIIELSAKAPDVGILPTDDLSTALGKYRNSATYTNDIRKGEQEIKLLEANTAKVNADAAKARADAQGLVIDTTNPQIAAVQRAIQFLTPGATADQRKDIIRTYQSMIQTGEIDQAKDYIKRVAREIAPIDENQKATGREEAIVSLNTIKNALDKYVAGGGDTGILAGSVESIANKIGRTKDPELAKLANSIRLSIVDYRRAVSGAAFTESEAAEYAALFPSIGNVPSFNDAKITSLLETFQRNQELFYSRMFGPLNYSALFGNEQIVPGVVSDRSLTGGGTGTDLSNNLFNSVFQSLTQ